MLSPARPVTAFLLVMATASCQPASTPAPPDDGGDARTKIELPAEVRAKILGEMRTMLGSLHDILVALPAGDTAGVRVAAERSGVAQAVDPELQKLVPPQFMSMGLAAHQGFDDVRSAVASGAGTDSVVSMLSRSTSNCVACHAMFRLVVKQP
jgi:hypothetical protein